MKPPKFLPGDFYAKYNEKRRLYELFRILMVEPAYGGIHVAKYSNLYPQLPATLKTDELTFRVLQISREGDEASVTAVNSGSNFGAILRSMTDENNHFGIMHMPLGLDSFDTGDFRFVRHLPLEEKDLEGFRVYLEGMEYTEAEQQEYIRFVLTRSHDRILFGLNAWLRWIFPLLALLLAGMFFLRWVHPAVPITGLVLLAALSGLWRVRIMRNLESFYERRL